uniref:Uncharacterized protein n=1 Tax=Ascaris lumbricoides TaxID=6252 RepID=A0A9J2Q8K8_ASCLU
MITSNIGNIKSKRNCYPQNSESIRKVSKVRTDWLAAATMQATMTSLQRMLTQAVGCG